MNDAKYQHDNDLPPLRSHEDIQKAHDVLVAFITDDVPECLRVSEDEKVDLGKLAAGFCWVLNHEHHTWAEQVLAGLNARAAMAGLALNKEPKETHEHVIPNPFPRRN